MTLKTKKIILQELLASDAGTAEKLLSDLPFEEAMRLLEELVTSVESGSLPLEQSLRSYESGVVVINHLKKLLSGAEERLVVLNKKG